MTPRKLAPPSSPLRVSRQATAPEQGCWCVLCLRPLVPLGGSVLASTSAASPSVPLRASRSATAPEQGLWCDPRLCCVCISPVGFHRRRFAQCPSESLPVSYGPGAGTLVRPSPVLRLRLPRGGWYGVSMCPAPSHTRTVGSFVGPPRRLLNDRNLSPLHPLPPLGLILFYWRWDSSPSVT
jgi:hypothetical protein